MAARKPLIAGNWKMYGRRAGLAEITALNQQIASASAVEAVICPPTPYLGAALDAGGADIAVAVADGRLHPVHALMRRTLAGDAHAALRDGARRLDAWQARHRVVQVPFDDAGAFTNINTLAERDALAAGMAI